MNPNYMNFFDPAAASGGMSMGNTYNQQSGFQNMPPTGSFMDMINGPPMGMSMFPPGQSPMARFNHYQGMYSPYPMENSAARLQQFARQMTPRPSYLPGQSMQDQMAMYNMQQQMDRMRMKQMPNYIQQRYNQPNLSPWSSRMPGSMPHLQQTPPRNPINPMQSNTLTTEAIRLHNMQHMSSAEQPPSFRKMPVLDEAPPIRAQTPLMPQRPQQSHANSQQYMNRIFSNNTDTPAFNSSTQQLPINLNSPGSLNLPGMSFPSPQQQRQTTSFQGSDFFSFTNELNTISPSPKLNTIPVPQSPKLTHFGPSTPSSVSSFDQQSCTSSQNSVTTTTTTTTFATSTSNVVSTDFTLKQAPTLSTSSIELNKQNDNTNRANKFPPYFSQMEQIQQLGRLKQQTQPQKNNELQLLTQQYQNTFQQYELSKQNLESLAPVVSQNLPRQQQQPSNPTNMNQQQPMQLNMGQSLTQPTTSSVGSNLHSTNQTLSQDLLSSGPLIDDGLNIPELDAFDSKGNFLTDDTKADSLFPAVFLGGTTDLFSNSSMFSGDNLTDIKNEGDVKKSETMSQTMSNVNNSKLEEKTPQLTNLDQSTKENVDQKTIQFPNSHIQNMNQQHYQNFFSPANMGQYFQQLPVHPMKQPDNFLQFPFHHPRFAPQSNVMMQQHMLSVSDFMSNTSTTNTASINSTNTNTYSAYGSMPGPFSDIRKGKGGKGKGKTEKGGKGKVGRPLGSLNKKKKKEKESKKAHELDPDDFDNLAPNELLLSENDENFIDPAMRRSLRERTKKKNYKDDFDYNLSDEDENKNKDADDAVKTVEPVISGGANALVAYRPNLEIEGEIAVIEKILAMRTTRQENDDESKMVEEFFVKYKGYSYLHCEWGTVEQLAKKDKRVHAKVKRYQQKRDTGYAFLNELDDEPFNPDYLEIDRVLDMQTTVDPVTNEKFNHYLVKWRALPYEESTWELQMNIDESIIKQFHELKKPPPEEMRRLIPRPHEHEWMKFLQSPIYKNGNKLHEYQMEGLNWLTFCWFKRINCILADEMGLGKTIQSISLLCAMKQYGIRGPFLVIAPLSTIANWQREFETWTDINAIVYHGSALSRNNIQQYEMYYKDEQGEFITSIYKFEAIITTYEMVLSANSFLCTIPFRCLIIDEAHRLKNQKCKLMEGLNNLTMEHKVLLTGTPLQNNVEELFSLLNFLEPTRFPSQTAFSYEFGNLKSEAQVEKLQQILKPMMLRRLKEDVDQNIPTKEETIVEVELTTIQKKFYRAILEKNFSFLVKGGGYSNLPNLMNTMMELRKCCNHPFLIKGAEDKIVMEYLTSPEDPDKIQKQLKAMIESSGKMVLIDKLLPKLKLGGHKVLIFSQMIKVLNLIEDYLVAKRYTFERIDGGVQGSVRQAAIDRFCRPDSDRFVFLLCTRAGGLGINLTAADTVIIFDSDWNPQNDLQAQARCHRIGQDKPVKVYRLICRNTYEREMFDRASLKLGLDKAVLQNMNAKDSSGAPTMTKKEVEDLLKKGAYGSVMETDEDANKFCEEDIDQILQRRTQIIQIKGEGKGSTFAKASFVSDKARQDINLDDPDFWKKWARKASIDLEDLEKDHQLIVDEPRKRKQTKRFGNDGDATVEMSDLESDDETYEPHKHGRGGKGQTHVGPIERAAWTRVECFKVEKMLLIYGWSRWQQIISHAHFRQEVRHSDIEAISRTILAYCYRYYKADDRSKQFFEDLINKSISKAPPKNDKHDITNQILGSAPAKTNRGRKGKGNSGRNALRRLTHQYSKPALIECSADWLTVDPETMIIDAGYRKHLQHHCSKIMGRVRLLHCLQNDIIKDAHQPILEGKHYNEINLDISIVDGDLPCSWWDATADKCLLIGTFKHGYEKYRLIRNDPTLSFYHKLGPMQFNDKAPGSPDSINNPGSVERSEDPSDPEFSVAGKRKVKPKKDVDDDDSFMESDEEKDSYSLNASPISTASGKENPADVKNSSTNPDLRWPLPTDMNTRLRRLVTAYLKLAEKEYLDIMRAEKDKQKQERLAIIALERQKKKAELQQKWTRREESDFYRVISNYGICYNRTTKIYNWERFKQLAKLEKKQDSTLLAYYEEFMAMCRKVCGKSTEEDLRKYKGSQLEEISEERASRCIQRIRLLSKIREQVLVHEKLEERLKLCQLSPDYPTWWEQGKHDKALLDGVAKHGLWRTEYHVLLDPDSLFKEIVTKSSQNKNSQNAQKSALKSETSIINGEHSEDSLAKLDPVNFTRKLTAYIEDSDSRQSMDSRIALPILTDEYAHVLSSWPKDKAIVSHLEKVCHCIIKGEWPKPTRFDITPIVSKLPTVNRTVISTVGQLTRAEPTSDKNPGVRGEEAAASRDFKIKSIDGLKLTVKTDTKKRKRKVDGGEPDVIEFFDDSKLKKKKIIDGVPIVEGSLRQHQAGSASVKYHIPKSSHPVSSTPIIHFPAVRVPKVSPPSKVVVSSITSPSPIKELNVSVLRKNDEKPVHKEQRAKEATVKTAPELTKGTRSSEQPVGIHIDSPNANVRIIGSKIEVKEKPSIKREIDLKSEVILKVPDPSKFLPSQEKVSANKDNKVMTKDSKKRSKPTIKSRESFPPDQEKLLKITNVSVKCEHRKEQLASSQIPPDSPRTRPERSAKKKAKDSISEITEAEHMSVSKELLPSAHEERIARSPRWSEVRSPTHMQSAHEYFRYDYYPERPARSPGVVHRHSSRSSPPMHRLSPDRLIRSPPLHSIHGRPLSPLLHRHSPPLRHLEHSPRLRDVDIEHMKHLYTEPLSPRHRSRDYYYSERSRSPIYYEYRLEKEVPYTEHDRLSPQSTKFGRTSPSKGHCSPAHKHESFPFVHLTEPRSPVGHRNRRHELHSPVQEGRFPYGHIVDWDGPRYKRADRRSPSLSSLDNYQYQPLSRLTPENKVPNVVSSPGPLRNRDRSTSPENRRKWSKTSSFHSLSREETSDQFPTHNHDKQPSGRRSTDSDFKANAGISSKNPPLAFYPVDSSKSGKDLVKSKLPKSSPIERSIIEIPEETMRSQNDRKTPVVKRKSIGLLEMKIQGLKKQKLSENTEPASAKKVVDTSESVTIPCTTSTVGSSVKSPKGTKSISAVLDSLSSAVRMPVISPPPGQVSSVRKPARKSLSLDTIAKNLTRSLEQSDSSTSLTPTRVSPLSPTFEKSSSMRVTKDQPKQQLTAASPSDSSSLKSNQRTVDPVNKTPPCTSPTIELTSPLQKVAYVTMATAKSPEASVTSNQRKSLSELVLELSTKERVSTSETISSEMTLSPTDTSKHTSPKEKKSPLGSLDRKIEELRGKVVPKDPSESNTLITTEAANTTPRSSSTIDHEQLERRLSRRASVISPTPTSQNQAESISEQLLEETATNIVKAALINVGKNELRPETPLSETQTPITGGVDVKDSPFIVANSRTES